MRIDVIYNNGIFNSFDTLSLTASDPFRNEGKNIVTEYKLRTDIFPQAGLVLDLIWHDAASDTGQTVLTNETTGAEIKVAFRHIGRRIVLVDPNRVNDVAKVVMGTQIILWKQGGMWANSLKLDAKLIDMGLSRSVAEFNEQALMAYQLLTDKGTIPTNIAADALGYDPALLELLGEEAAHINEDDDDLASAYLENPDSQPGNHEEDFEGGFDDAVPEESELLTEMGRALEESEEE